MAEARPSMQDLIRERRRSGFVGRQRELSAYRDNFRCPPEDPAHRFLFHVHGVAGVGKTWLLRRLQQLAAEQGAVTALVDEAAGSVPEAMEAISGQLAQQGHPLKTFDRLLQRYRQRRHEADAVVALSAEGGTVAGDEPSPLTGVAASAGLAGLGLVPGLGPVAGAMDPQQVAQGVDRMRAALATRLRSHDDVRLVLSPLQELTPAFLADLAEAADRAPWLALFFDTYERTGPVLDAWLRDVMTSERYGALPANVVVTVAGQQRLDTTRWPAGDFAAELPLEVFDEEEARRLIAAKGVADERVVEEILHLSGRLPVLLSMLAETRPSAPDAVGDPSGTAVEHFLKWVPEPVHRSAALAGALPLRLDEDVFRAAVEAVEPGAAELYGWLCSLPFVGGRAGRVEYHGVVRSAMLRVQRTRSPRRWREQHRALAAARARWRAELEEHLPTERDRWGDAAWLDHRLCETYHLLCADPHGALPDALGALAHAAGAGPEVARRWARAVEQAGADTARAPVGEWGGRLLAALDGDGLAGLCTLLLTQADLGPAAKARALVVRGNERRASGAAAESLPDFDRALELAPELHRARADRGHALLLLTRFEEAVADFTRALEHDPGDVWARAARGRCHRELHRYDEALADLDRVLDLDPAWQKWALVERGATHRQAGRVEEALADFERALRLQPGLAWAIAGQGWCYEALGRYDEALAAYDRALGADADASLWALSERARVCMMLDRFDDALADLDRLLADGATGRLATWAHVFRGRVLAQQGRLGEAGAAFDRVLADQPQNAEALGWQGGLRRLAGRPAEALGLLDRALAADPDDPSVLADRAECLLLLGRHDDARRDAQRALAAEPDDSSLLCTDAVVAQAAQGPLPAERWTAVEEALAADWVTEADRTRDRLLCRCATADWAGADAALAGLRTAAPYWLLLTYLRTTLALLAAAPGADRDRIETYRSALSEMLVDCTPPDADGPRG